MPFCGKVRHGVSRQMLFSLLAVDACRLQVMGGALVVQRTLIPLFLPSGSPGDNATTVPLCRQSDNASNVRTRRTHSTDRDFPMMAVSTELARTSTLSDVDQTFQTALA